MKAEIEANGYHCYKPAAWILAEGEDAYEFLQSQFSNDLSRIEIGQSVYGLWLDQKGKVHGDSFVCRSGEEEFRLLSYLTPESTILEKLNGFIVADDVELTGQAGESEGVVLIGNAVGLVETLGLGVGGAGISALLGISSFILRGRRGCQSAIEVITSGRGKMALLDKLKETDSHIVSLDENTMEVLRIAGLCPSIPRDIGPDELPQEAGLESDAVSFNKGCYLGQEVMSRLHSMGKVRRSLRLARSTRLLSFGSVIKKADKKVGIVKTSVPFEDSYLALVLLNNSVTEKETLFVAEENEAVSISLGS